jgi:cytochrome c553
MTVRITWKRVLLGLTLLATLGLAVAWLGIIDIGASGGHWAITDKFLHWSMRNAVRTQSGLDGAPVEPASPADPTELVSAAGHYAASCAFCHGAPGERLSPIMQASTPPPPDLSMTAGEWSDRELFWIVKHGVKFTAMPAWPAQSRDDEVRRMTAFLRRLPRMSPEEYRALAYGTGGRIVGGKATTVQAALPDCTRCHGEDGLGRGQPDVPILAGQKPDYLLAALLAYASGERHSGVMQPAAVRVDPGAMRALAEHYAALPGLSRSQPLPPVTDGTTEDLLAGRVVAQGLPEANLPACSRCHAPGRRALYPVLAGQKAEYMAGRLRLWRGDPTIVDARKPKAPMPMIARRIPDQLLEPLARYFARQ